MPWVFRLVLKWHDNSEESTLGDASARFPDPMQLQSCIVNFRAEVRAKARNKRKGRKNLTLSGRLKNVCSGKHFVLI